MPASGAAVDATPDLAAKLVTSKQAQRPEMSANDSDRLAQQDALFRAKVTRARQRSPGDKLLDGERLFHENAIWMKAGIRAQHPDFTPEQEEAEYRRRLAIARKLDNELFERVGTLCI